MIRRRAGARALVALVAAVATLLIVSPADSTELNGFDLNGALVPMNEIQRGGPPRDGIPSLDRPKFVAGRDAEFLTPDSRVLGVARNGIVRAYPIAILNWHEVVNDRFRGESVVVTFCPLCGTGMAFIANVAEQKLEFGVSGLLYNSDVLLYDRQTQSLWSQIASMAVTGPLKGRKLTTIPISHTSWADWRSRYPATSVLAPETGSARDYTRDPYEGYTRQEQLMFPVRHSSRRYHPKEQVIGIDVNGRHKAYPFTELARASAPFDDTIGGQRVRIEFDGLHRTGRVRDTAGRELASVIAFWFAWYAFHPDTEVFVASPATVPGEAPAPGTR